MEELVVLVRVCGSRKVPTSTIEKEKETEEGDNLLLQVEWKRCGERNANRGPFKSWESLQDLLTLFTSPPPAVSEELALEAVSWLASLSQQPQHPQHLQHPQQPNLEETIPHAFASWPVDLFKLKREQREREKEEKAKTVRENEKGKGKEKKEEPTTGKRQIKKQQEEEEAKEKEAKKRYVERNIVDWLRIVGVNLSQSSRPEVIAEQIEGGFTSTSFKIELKWVCKIK